MSKDRKRFGVISLGCPKNTADTESLLAKLPGEEIGNVTESETVIINTCAFLKKSREEVYENLNNLTDKKVILTGCLSTLLDESVFTKYPQVYAVVSGFHYPEISKIYEEVKNGKRIFAVSKEPMKYVEMDGKVMVTPPSYAYVKIAEGCNNGCSFCLIPTLKGSYRSRPMKNITDECKKLISSGVKEIILVAQDCGFYGADIYKKKALAELLTKITAIKGDFRVRILYIYPERITEELIKTIAENPKICKYFDIPLQHGDPGILKTMLRPYDVVRTLNKIAEIRKKIPGATFRTSLITGFPGETQKAFQNLLDFIKKIEFDHVGVFEYSREKGTKAYGLSGQLDAETKKARRNKAMLLQQKISLKKNKSLIGSTLNTLVEKFDDKHNLYIGRPERFAPDIDGMLYIKSDKKIPLNSFADVKITKADPYDMFGTIL